MATDEARQVWTSLILLDRYRAGDRLAAESLFARYFERLTALTRSRLSPKLSRRLDPEDIAISAYGSFFVGAKAGRYSLGRGGDLWRLLSSIAIHKLCRQVRHQDAGRRSISRECHPEPCEEGGIPERLNTPGPDEIAALSDEIAWVSSRLDPFGQRILELRLQGHQISEIAEDTGRSERSVRRGLAVIRERLGMRHHDG